MTTAVEVELFARLEALRRRAEEFLAGKVIAVMSSKGGVGKTLLAMELGWMFNGVLVDFDWDDGNATRALGHMYERFQRVPLLDAFASGRPPQPRRMHKRPALVPGHPDFENNQPSATQIRDELTAWALHWQRPVVVDCHPGGGNAVYGAAGAAEALVSPVQLATRELDATEGQLREYDGFPTILVPNEVPSIPPQDELMRLQSLATRHDVAVAPPIYRHGWYQTRKLRTVITASSTFSKRTLPFAEQLVAMGEGVCDYAAA